MEKKRKIPKKGRLFFRLPPGKIISPAFSESCYFQKKSALYIS